MLWLAAALYDRSMAGLEAAGLSQWRAELLSQLDGTVLEIGAGTGRNLEFYPPGVTRVVLAEPDRHMRTQLARRPRPSGVAVETVDAPAEQLPFPPEHFDGAVSTLVLCSVGDQDRALRELWRVLRPGGRLVFIEHVAAAPGSRRRRAQRLVEPAWRRLAGNCHLTRETSEAIARTGFEMAEVTAQSMHKAPPITRPTVRGVAIRPRRH